MHGRFYYGCFEKYIYIYIYKYLILLMCHEHRDLGDCNKPRPDGLWTGAIPEKAPISA